ncbi:hypothetical protein [Haloglycomyces albus]|uniref:hypothetical protein n=1 Tax=Haloglycomyces albus TaxID=526067 RepID=UPI00046D48C6|nr:hypothetical protein [Haloglycomyces albus]
MSKRIGSGKVPGQRMRDFKKVEKETRPRTGGDVAKAAFTSAGSILGAVSGLKAMGPAGVAMGASAGALAAEGGKHYATAWFSSSTTNNSATAGPFGSISELKSSVHGIIGSIRTECDAQVQGTRGQAEEALAIIEQAMDGSSNSLVSDGIGTLQEALQNMDEILSTSGTAKSDAVDWANRL